MWICGYVRFKKTWSASTLDFVKFDMTQTETVKRPEGCSDIRKAPCKYETDDNDYQRTPRYNRTKQHSYETLILRPPPFMSIETLKHWIISNITDLLHFWAQFEAQESLVLVWQCSPQHLKTLLDQIVSDFYRTQVSLGSILWVRLSLTDSI